VLGERVRVVRVAGVVLLAVACGGLAACGGGGSSAASARQYTANAAGLIDQLHEDLVVGSQQAAGLDAARRALHSNSDLYALLMAYDDFGSCRTMVRNVGAAGRRFARVEAALTSACRYLERASDLFTAATTRSDPVALVAASRTTLRASPLLFRAKAELVAATGRRR
jgi:hypothetical protein